MAAILATSPTVTTTTAANPGASAASGSAPHPETGPVIKVETSVPARLPAGDSLHRGPTAAERFSTAIAWGFRPLQDTLGAAKAAVSVSQALALGLFLEPVLIADYGLRSGVDAAHAYLHSPEAPQASPERLLGVSAALLGTGVKAAVNRLSVDVAETGPGVVSAALSIPYAAARACLGFWTLGFTTPLYAAYGLLQNDVTTPGQLLDKAKQTVGVDAPQHAVRA